MPETNFNPETDCLWIHNGYEYETQCEFATPKSFDDCPGCGKTTYKIDVSDTLELFQITQILQDY